MPIKEALGDPAMRKAVNDSTNMLKDADAGHWSDVASSLSRYGACMDLAHKAASRSKLDFGRDWDMGPMLLLPEQAGIKNLTRLLVVDARLRAAREDVAACCKDLRDAWRLSQDAGKEPILIGMLVEVSCQAIALKGVIDCAARWKGNLPALEALRGGLQKLGDLPDLHSALTGDAYMGITVTRNFDAFGGFGALRSTSTGEGPFPKVDPTKLRRTGDPGGMVTQAFLDSHLRYFVRVQKELDAHPNEPDKVSSAMDELAMNVSSSHKLSNLLDSVLLPVFSQAGTSILTDAARRVTTAALVDAMIVQAKTGRFPKTMSELPGVGKDPFNSDALHVKTSGGSIRIYSVGPNRKDDGGVDQSEAKLHPENYDVVAAYPPIRRKP